jgi:hypothetical protein
MFMTQKIMFLNLMKVIFGDFSYKSIRDRCYDFLNIFAKKIRQKIGIFYSKQI